MPNGLSNQPKLSHGALIDIDPQMLPPLVLQFQFNPDALHRKRGIQLRDSAARQGHEGRAPASQSLGEAQATLTNPEIITLDIRLDATDRLEQGDPTTQRFGVLPELSTLELMTTPRPPSPFLDQLGLSSDFGFSGQEATPVLVFVWGRYRVYPCRITELTINEAEHSPDLAPTRVIASVSLQVLESANPFTQYAASARLLALQSFAPGRNPIRSLINF